MPLQKFKVKEGIHYEPIAGSGKDALDFTRLKRFGPGDVIESEEDLVKKYENKFEVVQQTVGTRSLAQQEIRKTAIDELVRQGFWEESDREMLDSLSDKHFDRIIHKAGSEAARAAVQQPLEAHTRGLGEERKRDAQAKEARTKANTPGSKNKAAPSLGQDVTHNFQRAREADLKVWCNPAGKHQVTKADAPGRPINTKALEESEVDDFIEKHLEESEETQAEES